MALIYNATLTPSKTEMLAQWVPRQPWAVGVSSVEVIGAFRFDDPDGDVGIETHLVRSQHGMVLQVPVTYRGAPLVGADAALITTLDHSVLGRRWVYDAPADEVYVRALLHVVFTGGTQAELEYDDLTGPRRPVTTRVVGTGTAGSSVPDPADVAVEIVRVVDPARTERAAAPTGRALIGTWPGQQSAAVLAAVTLRGGQPG